MILKNRVFLLAAVLFLSGVFLRAGDAAFERLPSGWIRCRDLAAGEFRIAGRSYLRAMPGFEVEIFCADGVVTSVAARLDPELARLVRKTPPPDGFPPEFRPDERLYRLFLRGAKAGEGTETIFPAFGKIDCIATGLDLADMRPHDEFYWKLGKNWYFSVVVSNNYTIEKKLVHRIIPDWRQRSNRKPETAP